NVDDKDAAYFKLYIEPYEPRQLARLPKFSAIYHCMNQVAYIDRLLPPRRLAEGITSSAAEILAQSRARSVHPAGENAELQPTYDPPRKGTKLPPDQSRPQKTPRTS